MAVIKVIELLANSNKSWEDAIEQAVSHASKSIRKIKSVNCQNLSCMVDANGKINVWRINVHLSFEVDDNSGK